MHAFSILTLGIFIAGYSTARWDLVDRLYELAIFAWDHGVVSRAAQGFAVLSIIFFLIVLPVERLASYEVDLVRFTGQASPIAHLLQHARPLGCGISAREQLKRRGSF